MGQKSPVINILTGSVFIYYILDIFFTNYI
jgi:hypothetical protein